MARARSVAALLLLALAGGPLAATARPLAPQSAAQSAQQQQPALPAPALRGPEADGALLTSRSFVRGGGALATLGSARLARLARRAGWATRSPGATALAGRVGGAEGAAEALARILDADSDLAVDTVNEQLLYIDEGMAVSKAELALDGSAASPSAPDPVATTPAAAFALHSRPGAPKVIHLDFNGHTTTGTGWNAMPQVGGADIVSQAFDRDGSPATWSAAELADIVAIWRAVAEDYSVFDVDVTTEDPGDAALVGRGVRAVISGTDWYTAANATAPGGVAVVGSFGGVVPRSSPDSPAVPTPAFVFAGNLAFNAKYIWEAASHEVGHTLGLAHDGTSSSAYYTGQGNFAPIMGAAYYKTVTQFSKGEYTGASNQEDDFAEMSRFLTLLPQLNGQNISTATPLNVSVSGAVATGRGSGVVSAPGEADFFRFNATDGGTASITLSVTAPNGDRNRANLDALVRVYSANGSLLANGSLNPAGADPVNGLGIAAAQVALPAPGVYYVSVAGAGEGAPADSGYSAYGSRGAFALAVASWAW